MTKPKKFTAKCLDCGWEGSGYKVPINEEGCSCPLCESGALTFANQPKTNDK